MIMLHFFPIALLISVVFAAMKYDAPKAMAWETGRLFLKIAVYSAVGAVMLFFLVRGL